VSVFAHHRVAPAPNTYEDLIRLWQRIDEPLTRDHMRPRTHSRTPRILVAARCLYAVVVLTTLVFLPMVLRAVGNAMA
jgi:hypothetical protein